MNSNICLYRRQGGLHPTLYFFSTWNCLLLKTVLLLILQMGCLRAEAEIPTNDGRMDIVIQFPKEIIIIEVKFNLPAADGLKQIKDKDYAKKFRASDKQLTAVGLSIALGKDTEQKSCVVDVAYEAL